MLHGLLNVLHARLFHARLLHARFFRTYFLNTGLFHVLNRCRSSFCRRLMMCLRFRFSFALHLQPVFFQLLRVNRLLRALVLLRVLGTTLATVRTITAIATTTAAASAAAIAAPAARFFAILPGRTIAIAFLRPGVRGLPLLHGRPRLLLLLRARVALLIRPPFALGALCLRLVSLLRNFRVRPIAVRPVWPGLMLLRRALVAPGLLVAPSITVAALLVRPAAASVALLIATSTSSITSVACATSTASAAPMLVPVARFVVAALGALRPRGMHTWFVGC